VRELTFAAILAFLSGIAGMEGLLGQSHPTDRGSFLIGGGASLTSTKVTFPPISEGGRMTQENSEFSVRPSVQYFVVPGLAVGGDVSISGWPGEGWSLGGGPALTYFFFKGERPWNLYLSGGFQLGKSWLPNEGYGNTEDPRFYSFRAALGTVFMISQGVGIHTEAFYDFNRWSEGTVRPANAPAFEYRIDRRSFGLSVGISVFVF